MSWLKNRTKWQKALLFAGILLGIVMLLGTIFPNVNWFGVGRIVGIVIFIALVIAISDYFRQRRSTK